MKRLLTAGLLIASATSAALAALPLQRPYSGCGVVTLAPAGAWQPETIPLYRDPGVERIAEKTPQTLPRLAGSESEPVLAVGERRGTWLKVTLDDAGREGWVEKARAWRYAEWRDLLPGRTVRLLPGLKKDWYQLRNAPGGEGVQVGTLSRNQELRVAQVTQDWARVESPAGWLRWRDPDGRLTISLEKR